MNRWIFWLGVLSFAFLAEYAVAGDLCPASVGRELRCTRCAAVPCCCPDDYCRKPFPCISCPKLCGTKDDYCRPPMPCIPCNCMTRCADDYCRKPYPTFCWSVNKEYYRCPPCNDAGAASPAGGKCR